MINRVTPQNLNTISYNFTKKNGNTKVLPFFFSLFIFGDYLPNTENNPPIFPTVELIALTLEVIAVETDFAV